MYDSDSSGDFSLPPQSPIEVDTEKYFKKKQASPKSNNNATKKSLFEEEIDMDPYKFNMLDDYQQMQLGKMGDYLRWASLSSNMKRLCGFPSLSLSVADIISCLIFGIMKLDPQVPFPTTNRCDQLIIGESRYANIFWIALRETRAKGVQDPQHLFCNENSSLEGLPTYRNPWVIVSANPGKAKALGASIGVALGKNRQLNPSKTYCLLSEDSLNKDGFAWEAAKFGASCGIKLNRMFLIVSVASSGNEMEIANKFDAFKWYSQIIDGHDMEDICSVFSINKEGNSNFQWNLLTKIFVEAVKVEQKESFKKIEEISIGNLTRKIHFDKEIKQLLKNSPTIRRILQELFPVEVVENEDSYTMTMNEDFEMLKVKVEEAKLDDELLSAQAAKKVSEFSSKLDEESHDGKSSKSKPTVKSKLRNQIKVPTITKTEFIESTFKLIKEMPVCIICQTVLGKGYKIIENEIFDNPFHDFHLISENMEKMEKDAINLKRASEGFRIKCQPRLYEDSLLGKNSHPLNYLIDIEKRIRLNNIGIDERKMNSSFILSHFLVTGMSNDPRLVMLTTSSKYVRKFEKMIGKRYINTNGCDPCSIGLGMSIAGYRPIVVLSSVHMDHYYAPLKLTAYSSYAKSNKSITVVGLHNGVEDGSIQGLGCLGMGIDDLVLFRSLYGSSIVIPCDLQSYWKLLQTSYNTEGLTYIRSPSTKSLPNIIYEDHEVEFKLGGMNVVYSTATAFTSDQIIICACGDSVWPAIQAAKYCKSRLQIGCRVVDVYSLKPIASFELKKSFGQTGKVMTVESHMAYGGLYSAVAEHVPVMKALRLNKPPVCDKDVTKVKKHASIDKDSIIAAVKELCTS